MTEKDRFIGFKVSEDMRKAIKAKSVENGNNISQEIRRCLKRVYGIDGQKDLNRLVGMYQRLRNNHPEEFTD